MIEGTHTLGLRLLLALTFAAQLSNADSARAWETIITPASESSDPVEIGFDRRGNAFVAITGYWNIRGDGSMVVLSVRGDSGAERWQQWVPQRTGGGAASSGMRVDARGDVIAVGYTDDHPGGPLHEAAVVKLDGRSGEIKWRPALGLGIARHVELDRNGDAFVTVGATDLNVVKLSGANGSIRWINKDLPVTYGPFVVDGHGNVLVGTTQGVAKLSGRKGRELWRQPGGYVSRIELTGREVAYSIETIGASPNTRVVARDIESGRALWHRDIERVLPKGFVQWLSDVAVAGNGSLVLAVSSTPGVVEISVHEATNGALRWRRSFPVPRGQFLSDVAVADDGTVALLWTNWPAVVEILTADSGALLWRHEFTGLNTSPRRVAFDQWRNVVVAGDDLTYAPEGWGLNGAYVAKLDAASGCSFPCQN